VTFRRAAHARRDAASSVRWRMARCSPTVQLTFEKSDSIDIILIDSSRLIRLIRLTSQFSPFYGSVRSTVHCWWTGCSACCTTPARVIEVSTLQAPWRRHPSQPHACVWHRRCGALSSEQPQQHHQHRLPQRLSCAPLTAIARCLGLATTTDTASATLGGCAALK
jgi:hypothetical protein